MKLRSAALAGLFLILASWAAAGCQQKFLAANNQGAYPDPLLVSEKSAGSTGHTMARAAPATSP
ncbi:MAG: hypothetical protein EXR99_04520 [Gemmataceae bacterium]|nr:hypothetical protein [Gemmataceae bacterium]